MMILNRIAAEIRKVIAPGHRPKVFVLVACLIGIAWFLVILLGRVGLRGLDGTGGVDVKQAADSIEIQNVLDAGRAYVSTMPRETNAAVAIRQRAAMAKIVGRVLKFSGKVEDVSEMKSGGYCVEVLWTAKEAVYGQGWMTRNSVTVCFSSNDSRWSKMSVGQRVSIGTRILGVEISEQFAPREANVTTLPWGVILRIVGDNASLD